MSETAPIYEVIEFCRAHAWRWQLPQRGAVFFVLHSYLYVLPFEVSMGAIILGEYQPVPVSAAAEICDRFAKDGCIILSIDQKFERTNVTTYGVDAPMKDFTANFGDYVGRMLGGKLEQFEDFRATPAAMMKEAIDRLTRENAELRQRINRMEAGN